MRAPLGPVAPEWRRCWSVRTGDEELAQALENCCPPRVNDGTASMLTA